MQYFNRKPKYRVIVKKVTRIEKNNLAVTWSIYNNNNLTALWNSVKITNKIYLIAKLKRFQSVFHMSFLRDFPQGTEPL